MKAKKYFLILLVSIVLQASCNKDEGNYDYKPISDITIEGIESSYTVVSGVDSLKIKPGIVTSFPQNELEYAWELWTPRGRDTISRERDLNYPIDLAIGEYTLFYYVKHKGNGQHKGTGYFMNINTSVNVKTEFSEGFYILKETADANTELDLLLMDNRSRYDLLTRMYSKPLQGKPRNLTMLYGRQMIDPQTDRLSNSNSLGIITYGGAVNILRGKDLYRAFDHSTMFFSAPAGDIPVRFNSGGTGSEYYSSSGMYSVTCGTNGSGLYGFPEQGERGVSDLGGYHREILAWFYWNNTTNSIMYTSADGGNAVLYDTDYQEKNRPQIPTTNLNYECLYIAGGKNEVFIIFRDRADNSLVIYEIDGDTYESEPYITNVYRLPSDHILGRATHFTSYERGTPRYLYFTVNNKLYYTDMKTIASGASKPTFESKEYDLNLPVDETISYISHQHFTMAFATPTFNYLAVATTKGGKYKIYMYDVSVGGLPFGRPVRTASGDGKVKSVNYLGLGSYRLIDIIFRTGADVYFWNR